MRDGIFFGFFYLMLGVYIKKNEDKLKFYVNKLSKITLVSYFSFNIKFSYI